MAPSGLGAYTGGCGGTDGIGGTGIVARGFGWTHAGRTRAALEGIDLKVAPGERILLSGNSGSGKSTLLAALAGVLGGAEEGDAQGSLLLQAPGWRDGVGEPPGKNIPVGLILQDPDSQVIAGRVGDDVAFGCENMGYPRKQIWDRVRRALAMVGLDLPLDHPTSRLSGGQKQRLALAGVIAMGTGLILLDEPTANLDPDGAREVIAAVRAVVEHSHATLIVVEHQPAGWEGLLDRALVIEDGHLVEDTSFAEVMAKRRVPELPRARAAGAGGFGGAGACGAAALWSRNLVTRFGPPRSYDIPEGASTVITGANGSGKTTWLETVAGLLPKISGDIGVADSVRRGLKGDPHRWRSKELAHRIGYVFQDPEHQFVARTVREELEVGPKVMGVEVPHARIDELVERLRLGVLLEANPFTLSGGEKRRLSVAAALVSAPQVLLLDEPTFGQDPSTFAELVWLLRELVDASGTTVASITHDPLFSAALGDHLVEVK